MDHGASYWDVNHLSFFFFLQTLSSSSRNLSLPPTTTPSIIQYEKLMRLPRLCKQQNRGVSTLAKSCLVPSAIIPREFFREVNSSLGILLGCSRSVFISPQCSGSIPADSESRGALGWSHNHDFVLSLAWLYWKFLLVVLHVWTPQLEHTRIHELSCHPVICRD